MKKQRVLVTGGAGFIGSFLVDGLVKEGHRVRIFDNLELQVHQGKIPPYLNKNAEFLKGDIRDYKALQKALQNIDGVFHLAARVGVGQANYQIKEYVDTNIGGTANLLDIIVNNKTKIKKIIVTSSMTGYGEGSYLCNVHGVQKPEIREDRDMKKKQWEFFCSHCKNQLQPIPTTEDVPMNNFGMYAVSKRVQEQMILGIEKLYDISAVTLRLFNVYGPHQSLSNPYTGVSAIFISRLKNNKRPVIYEDGRQTRDFVSVHDVVEALLSSHKREKVVNESINIGTGKPVTIQEVAIMLAKLLKKDLTPIILEEGRKGDIRHCFADIKKARNLLDWTPRMSFERGLKEIISWSEKEHSSDLFEVAEFELSSKKLLYGQD